jgi:hypothetical protein
MTRIQSTLCGLAAAAVLMAAPGRAADPSGDRNALQKMAEKAETPREHVAVAKQFRLQAQHFQQKADRHEAEARRLESRNRSPMSYKWPAMGGQPWLKERQRAMEARRAAEECLDASERHMRMSVEKLAETVEPRSPGSGGAN